MLDPNDILCALKGSSGATSSLLQMLLCPPAGPRGSCSSPANTWQSRLWRNYCSLFNANKLHGNQKRCRPAVIQSNAKWPMHATKQLWVLLKQLAEHTAVLQVCPGVGSGLFRKLYWVLRLVNAQMHTHCWPQIRPAATFLVPLGCLAESQRCTKKDERIFIIKSKLQDN